MKKIASYTQLLRIEEKNPASGGTTLVDRGSLVAVTTRSNTDLIVIDDYINNLLNELIIDNNLNGIYCYDTPLKVKAICVWFVVGVYNKSNDIRIKAAELKLMLRFLLNDKIIEKYENARDINADKDKSFIEQLVDNLNSNSLLKNLGLIKDYKANAFTYIPSNKALGFNTFQELYEFMFDGAVKSHATNNGVICESWHIGNREGERKKITSTKKGRSTQLRKKLMAWMISTFGMMIDMSNGLTLLPDQVLDFAHLGDRLKEGTTSPCDGVLINQTIHTTSDKINKRDHQKMRSLADIQKYVVDNDLSRDDRMCTIILSKHNELRDQTEKVKNLSDELDEINKLR